MRNTIEIGTASAPQGEKGKGYLKVGELAGGLTVNVPIVIINGKREGQTLWVNGAAHGDEITGIEVVRRTYDALDPDDVTGALISTPISNVTALCARRHTSPFDELDLVYQTFPLNPDGSFSQRLACTLFNEIKARADYLLDFHALYEAMTPYTVFSEVQGARPEVLRKAEEMAKVFGAGTICKVDLSEAAKYEVKGRENSLEVFCDTNGIPAFMAEIGGKRMIEDRFVEVGVRGLLNVMKYLRMIRGDPELPQKQTMITSRRLVRSSSGGIARVEVNPGDIITEGSVIARVINEVFEEVEVIRAPADCFVIGVHRLESVVNTGDVIAFVGTSWKEIVR